MNPTNFAGPHNSNYKTYGPFPPLLPQRAFSSVKVSAPNQKSGSWQRYTYRVSQSYWRPVNAVVDGVDIAGDVSNITNFSGSAEYEILSGSNITGSYPITLYGDYQPLGTAQTGSAISFTGSIMPAGELFRFYFYSGSSSAVTSSYITDFKITTTNPTDTLPFSYMYNTGSSTFNNWYTGAHASASAWDDNNIHSLNNNLPEIIRNDSTSDDLKTFLNMWGENFDLTRNYIDNYISFYKRGYDKLNSVPTNLMPIIANSLGWELIAPFTGSLTEYFGGTDNELHGNTTTTETVTHNTWRKVINNLVYLYKSKGTLNSVDALLNIYGYPNDVISINEYGGSSTEHNPSIILNDASKLLDGMGGQSGSVSFVKSTKKINSWMFNGNNSRVLNFDWWTNDATGLDTIEFMLKPTKTSNNQIIVESSGSGTEKLWDLRLVSSASSNNVSKVEFRLNNSQTGSSVIGSNAVSM